MFQVIFSDEPTIAVLDDRIQTVYERTAEDFIPHWLKKTFKFSGKIMVWGQY